MIDETVTMIIAAQILQLTIVLEHRLEAAERSFLTPYISPSELRTLILALRFQYGT